MTFRLLRALAGLSLLFGGAASGASAASLSVSPISLDVVAEAQATTSLTVRNPGTANATVQVRVMRWTQVDGKDVLAETDAVVASPPIAKIGKGGEQTIRVVRISKTPIQGEEAYRLLVDELPSEIAGSSTKVGFVVRQSIPAFFQSPEARTVPLAFALSKGRDGTVLVGRNAGETYHRVLAMQVRDAAGKALFSKEGLVGYVLGGSSFQWSVPKLSKGAATVSGRTNRGEFKVAVGQK